MKWMSALIITFLLFALVNFAVAQIHFGLVGGLNFSNFKAQENNPFDADPDDFNQHTVLGFGAVFELPLNHYFSFYTQPMFLQKSSFYQEEMEQKQTYKLSYLELPLLLKFSLGHLLKPYLLAGLSFGYYLDGNVKFETGVITGEGSLIDIAEKYDFGVSFGGGISYDLRLCTLFIEGRYTLGLRNINKGGTINMNIAGITIPQEIYPLELKTYGTQIMGGVTLPLWGKK